MPRSLQEIQKAYEEWFLYYVESPERLEECFAKAQLSRFLDSNGTTLGNFLVDYFHPSDRTFLGKDLRREVGVVLFNGYSKDLINADLYKRYKHLNDTDLFLLDLVHQQVLAELENEVLELQTQMRNKPGQAGLFVASPTLAKLDPKLDLFLIEMTWASRVNFFNPKQWALLVETQNPEDEDYRDESRFNALSKSNSTQVIETGFYIGLGAGVGACIGAAVGSVIPIIGTSLGALIGSLIGAGVGSTKTGLYDLWQTHRVAGFTLATLGSADIGAGIGALLGTLIPIPGLGTFVGMAIGAGIGAVIPLIGGLIASARAYRNSRANHQEAIQKAYDDYSSNDVSNGKANLSNPDNVAEIMPKHHADEDRGCRIFNIFGTQKPTVNPRGKVSSCGIYSNAQHQVEEETLDNALIKSL